MSNNAANHNDIVANVETFVINKESAMQIMQIAVGVYNIAEYFTNHKNDEVLGLDSIGITCLCFTVLQMLLALKTQVEKLFVNLKIINEGQGIGLKHYTKVLFGKCFNVNEGTTCDIAIELFFGLFRMATAAFAAIIPTINKNMHLNTTQEVITNGGSDVIAQFHEICVGLSQSM